MEKKNVLLHTSSGVTRFQSIAGARTKLLEVETPQGSEWIFKNPFYLLAKLYDNTGAQIPIGSKLFITKLKPAGDWEEFGALIPYSNYYDVSEALLQDQKYAANVLHSLATRWADGIANPEGHKLIVYIESPVAVDLNQVATRFIFNAWENN